MVSLKDWLRFRRKYLVGNRNFEGYYTCSRCLHWFEHIEVDHIVKRSLAPDRIFDETNLRLLCAGCHRKVNPDY